MPPHAPQLIIANLFITCHPQRVRDLALLLDREQDVALHAKYEGGDVREGSKPVCEGGEVGGCIEGRRVGFGVGDCGVGDLGECVGGCGGGGGRREVELFKSGKGHIE